MRKYSHEQINELIQPLMDMMKEDYPNNAELIITPDFAMINYRLNDMVFESKETEQAIKRNVGNVWGKENEKI
jgi:hypothetical protein